MTMIWPSIDPKRGLLRFCWLLAALAVLSGAAKAPQAVKPSGLGIGLFVLAMLVGIPLAYRLWRETHQDDERASESEMFSDFEQAYAAGQMDEAEFRRLRDLMIGGGRRNQGGARPGPVAPAPSPRVVPESESPASVEEEVVLPPPERD